MLKSRGVVILYEDLCDEWVGWMKKANLTSLGVHKIALPGQGSVDALLSDLEKPNGREYIEKLEESGVNVEYELHAAEWLLPRNLFSKNPEYFRMNDKGERTPDTNLCPSNDEAMEILRERTYALSKILKQKSHLYYLWPDDAHNASCHCPKCRERGLSGADQGILLANAIADGVKAYDKEAQSAYLAYADAKVMPAVKPSENVFLEFAPMDREHTKPITDASEERSVRYVKLLHNLLEIFGADKTQILEYWMDNALYSGYKRPPVRIPFENEVCRADTEFYASLGIKNIKSFASYIDKEYLALHGEPPIAEYGKILEKYVH